MTRQQWEEKKCNLFTMEIHFLFENSVSRWHIYNQSWDEIRSIRETLFTHGFFLQRSAERGEVIFPRDLLKVYIDAQRPDKITKSPWKETV